MTVSAAKPSNPTFQVNLGNEVLLERGCFSRHLTNIKTCRLHLGIHKKATSLTSRPDQLLPSNRTALVQPDIDSGTLGWAVLEIGDRAMKLIMRNIQLRIQALDSEAFNSIVLH